MASIKRHAANPNLKESRTCLDCGACFVCYKSKPQKFCCVSCACKYNYQFKRERLKNTGRTWLKKGYKPWWDTSVHSRHGEGHPMYGKHLSAETKKKISIGKQGVSPAQWLGFIGNTDCMQRRAFQKTLQRRVFERDLYKCTICGVGGDLQVDHILSWAEHPALRFDMDNCRTLCAGCHYEVTFGRRMPSETRGWGHNLIKRSGVLVL